MAGFSNYLSWLLLTIALLLSLLAQDISAQCTSELSVFISNVSPESGTFVRFTCNVSSANFDRASWHLGETVLLMGENKFVDNPRLFVPDEVDIGDGCFNYGMGIIDISPEDAGEYTCRIGNATSTVTDVIVTPDVMYPTCHADLVVGASAEEDATVTLFCRTQTGNPPWSPTWGSVVAPGVIENVSTSGQFTTSLLKLPTTPEVLGSTFTCSAACNSSYAKCLPGGTRSCSIDGIFKASPRQQRIDAGDSANYTCKTSIRNYKVLWIVAEELQMSTTVNIECSVNNTSCELKLTNVDPLANGTQIPCALSKVGSNEIIMASSVTVVVTPESTTNIATTMPPMSKEPTTSQQPSTTPLITPPPPSPPTPPFVPTTPRPTTIIPTTLPTSTETTTTTVPTTIPITTPTTRAPTTILITTPTTRAPTMSRTSSPGLSSTLTPTQSGSSPNASVVPPTPDSAGNSSRGVSIGEIIAIVVTISILLIVLIVIFACVLVRRNASSEKRGKLRRDAAMLDSHAPSPFNAYDMQTVLGGKGAQEMSGQNKEKSGVVDSMGYLLPIPDLDAVGDDVDDSSFDNPAFDKDSALYASIPSNQNTIPPSEDRYQNGSIDQGYYEHYPDPDLGGGSRIVHGVISTVL